MTKDWLKDDTWKVLSPYQQREARKWALKEIERLSDEFKKEQQWRLKHNCADEPSGDLTPAQLASGMRSGKSSGAEPTGCTDCLAMPDENGLIQHKPGCSIEYMRKPIGSLKIKFECGGKGCFRQFIIEYQPGAKILGGTCICGHYTPFKEPALRTT